jgi:Uma2 family endonuclease
MSAIHEITVPETKPATEWVNGRALQKVTPQEHHARAQTRMAAAFVTWADETGSGRVGTEWEFRVTPPHEPTRPLVPDVAFLSYDRLAYERDDAAQIPYMAPDVAIEIRSPDDRLSDIQEKIRVYLASGAGMVLVVDPIEQTFTAHDADGSRSFSRDDTFAHESLPGLEIQVASVFVKPRPKRPA